MTDKIDCDLCEQKMKGYEDEIAKMNRSGVMLTAMVLELIGAIRKGMPYEKLSDSIRELCDFIESSSSVARDVSNLFSMGELNEEEAVEELSIRIDDILNKQHGS